MLLSPENASGQLFRSVSEQYELRFDEVNTVTLAKEKKNVSKGDLLEYRIKRLFFFMGYYVNNNIFIQTSQDL